MDTTLRPRRDFPALESRRMAAAKLFDRGHGQAEIVHRLTVSRQTASRWFQAWRRKGRPGLKGAGRAGRKPHLDVHARERLRAALLRGPTAWAFRTHLWTLDRVVTVIARACHCQVGRTTAWRLLGSLGWTRQRPMRRAKERDETAIAQWKTVRWPQVKKTLPA